MSITTPTDIEKLIAMWVNGVSARKTAPESWQAALDGVNDPEAELRLLALAGQSLRVASRPQADAKLELKPELPELALPSLQESTRATFRRLFNQTKDADKRTSILLLMAQRGYTAHPMDWLLDGAYYELPEAYYPWIAWKNDGGDMQDIIGLDLDANSWDTFYPAERLKALRKLRLHQPETVIELFNAKFNDEAAETRVKLIDVLSVNLNDGDKDFLEGLDKDRSGKVKQTARQLLARLGVASLPQEDLDELAAFFTNKKEGLLNRHRSIFVPRMKNKAQHRRLIELLGNADIGSLARALEVSPTELVASWKFDQNQEVDYALSALVGNTSDDAVAAQWIDRVLELDAQFDDVLTAFGDRLDAPSRRRAAEKTLQCGLTPARARHWLDEALGGFPLSALKKTNTWGSFIVHLRKEIKDEANANPFNGEQLFELGLIIDQPAAKQLLDELAQLGLSSFDLRLLPLKLNAELEPSPNL